MSVENQPNTILTEYSPFAWIEDTTTATVTGSFIDYPTAQNGEITFPGLLKTSSLLADTIDPNLTTTLKLGTTDLEIDIGRVASRTKSISIGNLGLGDGTTTGNIFIGAGANSITSSMSLGSSTLQNNFVVGKTLNLNNSASANSTIIGNAFTGNTVAIRARLTEGIRLSINNTAASDNTLTGTRTDIATTATVNVNVNNQYCYEYFPPFASDTGRYMINITTDFECSTTFNPYLKFTVYRRNSGITPNTTVLGTDTQLVNFLHIQKYYSAILTDKMTINLSGIVDFNPLLTGSNHSIGLAVKWLDYASGTFTLVNVNTVLTALRLA